MRLRTLITPIALGLAARAIIRHRRNQRHQRVRRESHDAAARHADSFASDPGDPVQGFDEVSELQVAPLEVDARSIDDAETEQDLAGLESEVDEIASNDDAAIELVDIEVAELARGVGDLHGAHAVTAVDRIHLDDGSSAAEEQSWEVQTWGGQGSEVQSSEVQSSAVQSWDGQSLEGQSWIEALETSAIENGADPELELDDNVDDEDVLGPMVPPGRRDTPIADLGSGGRRGL